MTVLEIRTACPRNYDGLGSFRPVSVLNSMTSLFYQLQGPHGQAVCAGGMPPRQAIPPVRHRRIRGRGR